MKAPWECLILSLFASSLVFAQSAAPGTKPVISLQISAKPTLKVGSGVGIHVVLTNLSAHDIVITRDVRGTECTIDVRDENGKWPPDTKFGLIANGHSIVPDPNQIDPKDLVGALVEIPVKAGNTWTWDLDAAKFYDLSKPGKYAIFIQRLDPESPMWVKSNTIQVIITP